MAGRVSAPSTSEAPTQESGGSVPVPKTNRDPVASLAPFSLNLTVLGKVYEVPARPASYWLGILMALEPDFWDLFPGCLEEEDQDTIHEALMEGSLEVDEFDQICLGMVTSLSAREWWVAIRLIEVARINWQTLGAEMLMRGIDADKLSLAGWLDVLLFLIMRNIDPKESMMFTLKLEMVPPGIEAEQPEPEISESAFMSMA